MTWRNVQFLAVGILAGIALIVGPQLWREHAEAQAAAVTPTSIGPSFMASGLAWCGLTNASGTRYFRPRADLQCYAADAKGLLLGDVEAARSLPNAVIPTKPCRDQNGVALLCYE